MEPSEARLYTDEDIHGKLAPALRELGYDAVSASDTDRLSTSDDDVWRYFIEEDRVLLTYNVKDFAPRHKAWIEDGKKHPGIIFSVHYKARIGPLISAMRSFLQTTDRETLRNNALWLPG